MKSKNLFLFLFILLINRKIFICSQDSGYGYIELFFEKEISDYYSQSYDDFEYICNGLNCNISFTNDFKNFTFFLPIMV